MQGRADPQPGPAGRTAPEKSAGAPEGRAAAVGGAEGHGRAERRRIHVRGVVQGVGFRPFVHRLADSHGLSGWVRNESGEVFIEVEGERTSLEAFEGGLREEAPLLARIDHLEGETIPVCGTGEFRVLPSLATVDGRLPVSPDVAICEPCLRELRDPIDRRYRYPFITCTDCGPRYTVIESMPYDRERTSMRLFQQCPACQAEYGTPSERRYHSETNSCHACGPHVWLASPGGERAETGWDALESAAQLLMLGGILAIRGLGGYHLAVDARNESAVRRLRAQKGRDAKPLAIMVVGLDEARSLAHVSPAEEALLRSRERPIVLLRSRTDSDLAPSVSPGLDTVGIMLAYTPLHHLLLDLTGRPLVMTSGNVSELPICTSNEEALERLTTVAGGFLMHDREIVSRYDDSVVRVMAGRPVFLRRARGYAPLPIPLPVPAPEPLLAVGPHLKNTFTLAAGDTAFVSQHVGDLENVETLDHLRASLFRFRELFRIEPAVAVRDLHPGYLSTRIAGELSLPRTEAVQHHHAHVAAVAAEHGVLEPVVGVAYDGVGYGDDGHIWGSEILVADLLSYRRVARLRYAPMPGGDLAARRPWRAAAGYLSLEPELAESFEMAFRGVRSRERRLVEAQIERRVNAPLASSMGRLFDAAAAILGVRRAASYEGQAAMELESLAARVLIGAPGSPGATESAGWSGAADRLPHLPFPAERDETGVWVMDPLPLLEALGSLLAAGEGRAVLAAAFHVAVARTTGALARGTCAEERLHTVALGGGVFQNALLLPIVEELLHREGLRVLVPTALGPNDGAISYGQAAVAAARLSASTGR